MITPEEAYAQSTILKKEDMDRFENDNPQIIEEIENAIDEGITLGRVYTHIDSSKYSSITIKEIISFLHFLGYNAEHDFQRESIWINWSRSVKPV